MRSSIVTIPRTVSRLSMIGIRRTWCVCISDITSRTSRSTEMRTGSRVITSSTMVVNGSLSSPVRARTSYFTFMAMSHSVRMPHILSWLSTARQPRFLSFISQQASAMLLSGEIVTLINFPPGQDDDWKHDEPHLMKGKGTLQFAEALLVCIIGEQISFFIFDRRKKS